jgi:hypothetical protein
MTAALLAAIAVLAAANLYFDPAHVRTWAVPLAAVGWMTAAWWLAYRRSTGGGHDPARAVVQHGLVFGVLIVYAALAAQMTNAIGLTADVEVARRITMALVGAFFVVTGNALPKRLTPRMAVGCAGARTQAMHRFSGWTWVVAGIAMAAAWLTLSLPLAKSTSLALMIGSSLAVITRAVTIRSTHRQPV